MTSSDYSLEAIGQLCRDRADCENGFDELKKQWGRGGYTIHDLDVATSQRGQSRLSTIGGVGTSDCHTRRHAWRQSLAAHAAQLGGIARLTLHAGQSRLLLTLTHAARDHIKSMIANIRKGLDHVLANAPQLTKADRWGALARYIINKIMATRPKNYSFSARLHPILLLR